MELKRNMIAATVLAAASSAAVTAFATDLEVMHWWTSGGESAALSELAKAFDATGNTWVDAAVADGRTARSVMVSRMTGGDPIGAFQFNHGRQAEQLIQAGFLRDITDIAEAEGWLDVVTPSSLLESCTVDGRIYCAPVNIHSWQWLWLSHKAYETAGVEVPTNWNEFVASAPALLEAGLLPLAVGQEGWQQSGLFNVLFSSLLPSEVFMGVYGDKDADLAAGSEVTAVFEAADVARTLSNGSTVQSWNEATNLVITGQAGGQIMGDWAQGEFAFAEQVAGEDYSCLPGLGVNEMLSTGGDAFYFPALSDAGQIAAQSELAALMLKPETQVAFNLKKGSLPVRGDIDLNTANDCMQKGVALLKEGATISSVVQLVTQDTYEQINTLFVQFFADDSMTVEDAQAEFAIIISRAY